MSKDIYSRKFCVAPMMGYTTPHARKLYRILSKKAFLFTEMIPAKTLVYSNKNDQFIENNHEYIGLSEKSYKKLLVELSKSLNNQKQRIKIKFKKKGI